MNKKIVQIPLVVVALFLWWVPVQAQDFIGYHSPLDNENYVSLQSDYQLGANALSNRFLLSILNEPFLEKSFLEDYDGRQKPLNRIGYLFDSRAQFHFQSPIRSLTIGVGLEQTNIESVRYTNDAFHTVFFGNKDFKGLSADFGDIQYTRYNYSTLRVSLNFHSQDRRHHFSLLPAFHLGHNHWKIQLDDVSMYTADDASAIDLEGSYLNQKTNSSDLGIGGSFGMQYIYSSNPHYFRFSVSDVGRLYWKNVETTSLDSSLSFNGFDVQNLFQADAEFSAIHLDDTLSNILNSNSYSGSKSIWLPIHLQMEYIYALPGDKWDIGLQFKQRFMIAYKPYFRLDAYHHFNEKWHMSGIVSYGGFSGLNVGASALYQPIPKLRIALETQYLSSLVLFSQTTGLGGFINFSYQL